MAVDLRQELASRLAVESERRKVSKDERSTPRSIPVALPRSELIPSTLSGAQVGGGYQKGATAGGGSLYNRTSISLRALRAIARKSALIQAIHSVRRHQIYRISHRVRDPKRDVGWRVLHKDHFNPSVKVDKAVEERISRQIEETLLKPHPVHEKSFANFLCKCLDDHLTINRVCIERFCNVRGQPVQFMARDGEEILPTFALVRRYGGGPMEYVETAAIENVRGQFARLSQDEGFDVASDSEYVVIRDGRLIGAYLPGQMHVATWGPGTETKDYGYPPSHVERAIEAVVAYCLNFEYTSAYFSRGFTSEGILLLAGGYLDDAQMALQDQLRSGAHGLEGAHQFKIIGLEDLNDAKFLQIKQGNKEMEFSQWMLGLISHVTATYRMDPTEINFKAMDGGGAALFEHSREVELTTSKDQGLGCVVDFLEEAVTDAVVHDIHPDYEWRVWGLDREDEAKAIELRGKEIASYRSIDEVRIAMGEEPYGEWWSEVPGNPAILQYVAQERQAKQAQEQQAAAGQQPVVTPGQEESAREIPNFEGQAGSQADPDTG